MQIVEQSIVSHDIPASLNECETHSYEKQVQLCDQYIPAFQIGAVVIVNAHDVNEDTVGT